MPLELILARLQLLSALLPSGMIPNTQKQDSHAGFCLVVIHAVCLWLRMHA